MVIMVKMRYIVLVLVVLALASTGESQLCLSGLRGWNGTLFFPQMRDTEFKKPFYTNGENTKNNCIFYLNTKWAKEIKLTLGMIKIGKPNVVIKTVARGSKKWSVFHTLTGTIPVWIDLYAVDVDFLKVVVPKTSGSFFMDYEMSSCPALPSSMKMIVCTKKNYFASQCITECGNDYYSKGIDENKFHARCWRNHVKKNAEFEWKFSFPASSNICVSKDLVEEKCFTEKVDPACPFKFNDLLLLMGEKYEIPKKEERFEPAFNFPELAGSRSFIMRPPPPPITVSNFMNVLKKTCRKKFCNINPETKKYAPLCGKVKGKNAKRVCMMCRKPKFNPCQDTGVIY